MKSLHDIAQQSLASQDKWELEQLLLEVDRIHPENILEIGVHLGGGMRVFKEAFQPVRLLGIEQDTCYPYPNLDVLTGVSSHDASTFSAVEGFFDPDPIDFIFIDGDHTYAGVKKDFEDYSELVREGGIVAFHDARLDDNETCDVFKFWREVKVGRKYKELFNPSGEGTGVGVIYL